MGNETLQPGCVPANAPSRRGFIGALAAAPVLAGSLAASASAGAAKQGTTAMNIHTTIPTGDRTSRTWDAAYARWRAALAAHETACTATSQVEQTYIDYCRSIAPTGLRDFRWAPVTYQLTLMPLDQFALLYDIPHVAPGQFDPAAVAAEVALYREGCAAARVRLRLDEFEEAQEHACHADSDALDELVVTPAPSMAALAVKVALLRERDCDETFTKALLDDVRRLSA